MPWGVVAAVAGAVVSSAMAPDPSSAPPPSGGGQGSGQGSQPAAGGQAGMGGALGNLYLTGQGAQAIQNAGVQSATMADPFAQSRQQANTQLQSLMSTPGSMANDPQAQFAMQQGLQAADRGLAANHQTNSGNAQMELMQYGQGLSNQNYNARLGQLSQMASQGASPSSAASNYLNATVTAQSGLGNAQAQAMDAFNPLITSAGNSIGGAVSGGINSLANYYGGSSSTPTTSNVMGDSSFYNQNFGAYSGAPNNSYTPSYSGDTGNYSSGYSGYNSGYDPSAFSSFTG